MRGVRSILFVNRPERVISGLESMETGLESMETALDTLGMPGEMLFECGDEVIVDKPSSTFDRPYFVSRRIKQRSNCLLESNQLLLLASSYNVKNMTVTVDLESLQLLLFLTFHLLPTQHCANSVPSSDR